MLWLPARDYHTPPTGMTLMRSKIVLNHVDMIDLWQITKNHTPLVHFAWLFYNQTIFQKSVWGFLDQVAGDAKNV